MTPKGLHEADRSEEERKKVYSLTEDETCSDSDQSSDDE